MDKPQSKVKSFTDLKAWQEGHILVVAIYGITQTLPRNQMYSLADQLQRSAVSITSNIAEGFARHSSKDQLHFLYIALGSTKEVQNQLLISRDVGFIDSRTFQELAAQSVKVSKLLNGLIKSNKSRGAQ
jgi:four helix bundle protein